MSLEEENGLLVRQVPVSGVSDTVNRVNAHYHHDRGIPFSSDARRYLHILYHNRRQLLLTVLVSSLLSLAYLYSANKVYQANALLRIEGESSLLETLLEKGRPDLSETPLAKEESRILQSRAVLGSVVDSLDLAIESNPVFFPIAGKLLAAFPPVITWINSVFPNNGYAWGGESIVVESLDVPESMQGKKMTLVAEDGGLFSLSIGEQMLVEHAAPSVLTGLNVSRDGRYSILVSRLDAPAGTHFDLYHLPRGEAIDKLRRALSINSRDVGTQVIELVLTGDNREKISQILNRIVKTYRNLRLSWSSHEARQELSFLDSRLPTARAEMEEAENALADFQKKYRSIDMDTEAREVIGKVAVLEAEITDLKAERYLLSKEYTAFYPEIEKLDSRIAIKEATLKALRARKSGLPEVSKQLLSLQRNLDVRSKLYTSLQERYQKQRVAEASSIGSVRLIDTAVPPEKPVWPKVGVVLPIGIMSGLFLHLLYLFIRAAFSNRVSDIASVENSVGLPVYLDIPYSNHEMRSCRRSFNWLPHRREKTVLALSHPDDFAVETLRSLRTMLTRIMADVDNRVLMICGPLPRMGKSFVSANLAVLLAKTGKKVLLVDGDFYRGNLHGLFGLDVAPGLTDALDGRVAPEGAIRKTDIETLDILPRGRDGAPGDALLETGLREIIETLENQYDYVLIDAPPILSMAATAVIGQVAGASIMVVRAEAVTIDEMKVALNRLALAGVKVNGCLVNNLRPQGQNYAYRYGYSG